MDRLIKTRNILRVIGFASILALVMGAGSAYAGITIGGGNDTTGESSENENMWEVSNEMDLEVGYEFDAEQDFDIGVDSGSNGIDCNTEVGDVETGDVGGAIEVLMGSTDSSEGISFDWSDNGDVEVDMANETTGASSENENKVEIGSDINLDIDSETEIDNEMDLGLNTGNNDVSRNTVAGDVSTGDIEADASIDNSVACLPCIEEINLPSGSGDVEVDLSNDTTGYNSINENEVDISNDINADIETDTEIENDIEVRANTGENDISNNTVVDDVETGSIDFSYSIIN